MAFDAANAMFGAKYGYRVVASGSHHEMFRRRAPDWLTGPAFQQVAAAAAPRDYEFRGRVLEQTEAAAEQERTSGAPRLSSAEHLPRRTRSRSGRRRSWGAGGSGAVEPGRGRAPVP